MTFDKWFNSQSRLLKVLLLILPVVGWIVECLIRLSVMLRTKSLVHIVIFLLFLLVGWTWLLCVVDLIYLIITGQTLVKCCYSIIFSHFLSSFHNAKK